MDASCHNAGTASPPTDTFSPKRPAGETVFADEPSVWGLAMSQHVAVAAVVCSLHTLARSDLIVQVEIVPGDE